MRYHLIRNKANDYLENLIAVSSQSGKFDKPIGCCTAKSGLNKVQTLAAMKFNRKRIEYVYDETTGEHVSDPAAIRDLCERFFQTVWGPPEFDNDDDIDAWCSDLPPINRNNIPLEVPIEAVEDAILNVLGTLPGPDGIPFWVYKKCPRVSSVIIHKVFFMHS